MKIQKFQNPSRFLGKSMSVAIYGHFGQPLLCFPTAAENFEEFERQGNLHVGAFVRACAAFAPIPRVGAPDYLHLPFVPLGAPPPYFGV